MIESGTFSHHSLGTINLRALATARRITARWRGTDLHVTAPRGISGRQLLQALDEMTPTLIQRAQHEPHPYRDGYTFTNDLLTITIVASNNVSPGRIISMRAPVRYDSTGNQLPQGYIINAGYGALDSADTVHTVERLLDGIGRHAATTYILPEARAIIAELDARALLHRHPTSMSVSRGMRTLGTCSATGAIRLSQRLSFMPANLRRAIITHELAHLDCFDHSTRFYERWRQLYGAPVRDMQSRYKAAPTPYFTR